jgi:hypothetical protein
MLPRPGTDELRAAAVAGRLSLYPVMRASQVTRGHRLGSVCWDGSFRPAPHAQTRRGALVLLSNGERLYDVGHGIRNWSTHKLVRWPLQQRFILAGCPRQLSDRIAARLMHGPDIEVSSGSAYGAAAYVVRFGTPRRAIELVTARNTLVARELHLGNHGALGTSDLAGGGTAVVRRVARAFGINLSRPGTRASAVHRGDVSARA